MVTSLVLLTGYAISCSHQVEAPPPAGHAFYHITVPKESRTGTGAYDALSAICSCISPRLASPATCFPVISVSNTLLPCVRCMTTSIFISWLSLQTIQKVFSVSPWYFNPATSRWAQEATSKAYDQNGVLTRDGFGEDKLAMLWIHR